MVFWPGAALWLQKKSARQGGGSTPGSHLDSRIASVPWSRALGGQHALDYARCNGSCPRCGLFYLALSLCHVPLCIWATYTRLWSVKLGVPSRHRGVYPLCWALVCCILHCMGDIPTSPRVLRQSTCVRAVYPMTACGATPYEGGNHLSPYK